MSCQDVCLYAGDGDRPEFYVESTPRARKEHKCCECGRTITVGEKHQAASGKWDGDISTYRTCAECVEIRAAFCCDGWTFLMLWESIRDEMFGEWRKNELRIIDCLAKLASPTAVAKMREEYAEYCEALDQ